MGLQKHTGITPIQSVSTAWNSVKYETTALAIYVATAGFATTSCAVHAISGNAFKAVWLGVAAGLCGCAIALRGRRIKKILSSIPVPE